LPWGLRTQEEEGDVVPGDDCQRAGTAASPDQGILDLDRRRVLVGAFWLAVDRFGLSLASIAIGRSPALGAQ
jgi:predicted secreted protein